MTAGRVVLHFFPEPAAATLFTAAATSVGRRLVAVTDKPESFEALGVEVFAAEAHEAPETLAQRLLQTFGPGTEAFTGSELRLPDFAVVQDRLGAAANELSLYTRARDKWHMKRAWVAAGVATARATLYDDLEGLLAAPSVEFPAILKPRNGFASCGVRKVKDKASLAAAGKALARLNRLILDDDGRKDGGFLVEEFIDGREYAVDTIWVDGEARVDFVMTREVQNGETFPDSLYCCDPRMDAALHAKLTLAAHAAGRALGQRSGSSHAEMRVRDGTVYLIEMTPRAAAGGFFHRAFREAYGFDTAVLALLSELPSMRGPLEGALRRSQQAVPASALSYYYQPLQQGHGRVSDIVGIPELLASPFVRRIELFCAVGSFVPPPDLSLTYWAWILGTAPDEGAMMQQLRTIDETLQLRF